MNPRVTQVVPLAGYGLILTFSNGETRRFDLSPYLRYPVFEPLRNEGFFMLAKPSHGTVAWTDEIDFDPDTLYLESVPVAIAA